MLPSDKTFCKKEAETSAAARADLANLAAEASPDARAVAFERLKEIVGIVTSTGSGVGSGAGCSFSSTGSVSSFLSSVPGSGSGVGAVSF